MILRLCIGIPCFDNSESVADVVKGCLEQGPFPVIVCDDGSQIPVQQTIESALSQEDLQRVSIFRLPENSGKGVALQKIFAVALQRGFTHVLTIDADGQHPPSQISKLVRAALDRPFDLIIGARQMAGPFVPKSSLFGRWFSNFWVQYETGAFLKDSQSGLRLYPLFHLQSLKFFSKRYDFEIEVLIRLMWRGVSIQEVDIEVLYPKERVTHFHKFWDNFRITLLNIGFVLMTMVKKSDTPVRTSMALALGVFVGCTPFYGFHTPIAFLLAFAGQFNFTLMWIGTNVSNPLFVPFLVTGSVWVGRRFFGRPEGLVDLQTETPASVLNFGTQFFSEWLVGSMFVGLGLGFLVFLVSFLVLRLRKKSKPKAAWTGKMRGGRFGTWFMKWLSRNLGITAAYFMLFFIVPYFYLAAPRARKSLQQFWRRLEPDLSFLPRQWQILKHFFVFGQILIDRVYQAHFPDLKFERIENSQTDIVKILEQKRGLIFLGAHVGGWSISSALFSRKVSHSGMNLLQYESEHMNINQLMDANQAERKIAAVSQREDQSTLKVRQRLQDGETAGLLADRALGSQFELVPFLGGLAAMDTRAFRLAALSQSPLVFTLAAKEQQRYRLFCSQEIFMAPMPAAHRSLKIYHELCAFAQFLESFVRNYPHQWFNFFPYFSAVPTPPPATKASRDQHYLVEELSEGFILATDQ